MKNKSVSNILISVMLFLIVCISIISFNNWNKENLSEFDSNAEDKKKLVGVVDIYRLSEDTIFIYNEFYGLRIDKLFIEENECEMEYFENNQDKIFPDGNIQIKFDNSCVNLSQKNSKDVIVQTNKGLIKKKIRVE